METRDQWARRLRSAGVIRNSLAGLVTLLDLSQTTSTGPSLQRAIAFAAGIFYPPPPPTAAPGVDCLDRHSLEFLLPWLSLSTQFASGKTEGMRVRHMLYIPLWTYL